MSFVARRLEFKDASHRTQVLESLKSSGRPMLVLSTCQRVECYGHTLPTAGDASVSGEWAAEQAFIRLARIAAGLESRILGELEVLGQVRNSYKEFAEIYSEEDRKLDRIFQDAIALARKARKLSGIDQNMTSLSGLAASDMLRVCTPGAPLAVIGTGSLASSIVRYLQKRGESPIRVMGRCPEKAISLAMQVGGFGGGLDDLAPALEGVGGIISATAAPHPVIYPHHLEKTEKPIHIIDLGEPADCSVEILSLEHVRYTGLLAVEARAQINSAHRRECAAIAAEIINQGARTWAHRGQAPRPVAHC